jgi:hypothetical protein
MVEVSCKTSQYNNVNLTEIDRRTFKSIQAVLPKELLEPFIKHSAILRSQTD